MRQWSLTVVVVAAVGVLLGLAVVLAGFVVSPLVVVVTVVSTMLVAGAVVVVLGLAVVVAGVVVSALTVVGTVLVVGAVVVLGLAVVVAGVVVSVLMVVDTVLVVGAAVSAQRCFGACPCCSAVGRRHRRLLSLQRSQH